MIMLRFSDTVAIWHIFLNLLNLTQIQRRLRKESPHSRWRVRHVVTYGPCRGSGGYSQAYHPVGPPVGLGFVADGVALREVYLRVFRLSQVSIILPILSTHSLIYFRRYIFSEPIPVVARSKVRVWGCSLAGIAAANPSGDMTSLSCECCVLSGRGLWDGIITRPEESYQVRCVWVWLWRLDNEEEVLAL